MTKMYVIIWRVNKKLQEFVRPSDCHLHVDLSVRLVPLHLEVVDDEVLDPLHFPLDAQLWERERFTGDLAAAVTIELISILSQNYGEVGGASISLKFAMVQPVPTAPLHVWVSVFSVMIPVPSAHRNGCCRRARRPECAQTPRRTAP